MRVLVTGAAGFIGSKVCETLTARGHGVIGVDNLNDAYDVRLKDWRLAQLAGMPGFEFHQLDIRDRPALRALFNLYLRHEPEKPNEPNQPNEPKNPGQPDKPFDAVINLAARAGVRPSVENPWVYYETNATGCLNLLDLCRELEVRKFVLASTSSLYGVPGGSGHPSPVTGPRSEVRSQSGNVEPRTSNIEPGTLNVLTQAFREDDSTDRPLSPYAASKKAAEALCYTYHYLHGIDVSVLRYFTVYGPGGRPDMSLFRFVQWVNEGRDVTLFGDGEQSRDFTYVDDIARGTVAALKPLGFAIINLGSDKPVVLNQAIRIVENLLGRKAKIKRKPRHPADVLATWADVSRAKELLKWEPETYLDQGLANLVAWYQENRVWAKEIDTGG